MLRIAKRRLGSDFRYVSDEYLIRPAEEDFWRLESSDEESYHVSRIVSSKDGVAEINETQARTAARITKVIPLDYSPAEYKSIGISPQDQLLVLDDRGATHELSKLVTGPHKIRIKQPIRQQLVDLHELHEAAQRGQVQQLARLTNFLIHHGPVDFDHLSPTWRRLLSEMNTLRGVSQLSKRADSRVYSKFDPHHGRQDVTQREATRVIGKFCRKVERISFSRNQISVLIPADAHASRSRPGTLGQFDVEYHWEKK